MKLIKSILAPVKYLRLHSFDSASEKGRAAERYRLALWAVIANVFSKSVSMLVMVLSVSLTLPYLGTERFGVWMTIASFVGMLVFLDLGVGNALTNRIAQVATSDQKPALRRAISGGLGLLFFVSVAATLVLCTLAAYVPWSILIKGTNPAVQEETRHAMFLFAALFGATLFSSGVHKVFAGLQRSFEAHAASALGSVVSLISLWWAASDHAGIPALLLVTLGGQILSGLLLLAVLARRDQFHVNGMSAAINGEKNSVMKLGGLFFVLQIGTMVGWGADSLIISSTLGAGQVAVFAVVQRLFQFISAPLAIANAPLWSAYADANSRGDRNFIYLTLKKSLALTAVSVLIFGGILTLMSQYLVRIWTAGEITVPISLVIIFFIWTLCESVGNAFAMMMNGCGVVKPQVFAVLIFLTLAIPLKIYFAQTGLSNLVGVTVFSYILAVPGFYLVLARANKVGLFSNG